jgi:uncharacterized protein (DUF362 family)/Pyruvate/2-oxoacid:ferredoxin oxidoreductase delta subunit
MKTQVSLIRCLSYQPDLVRESVKRGLSLLGGISAFIKPKSKVLVKPNLLMAKQPEYAITTHPEVVRAVLRLLKEINCKIIVGDGPSVWGYQAENSDNVYDLTGIKKVCLEEEVELVKFEKRRWHGKFPLTTWIDECDHIVNVPKFKTHGLTILTAALKNLFGLISGTYKTELHKNYFKPEDFAKAIVDIYEKAKPDLTIVDGIVALEGDGPATAGKIRPTGLLLAGADCVALDSVLTMIMGLKPLDILVTKEAVARGLGIADIDNISILGDHLKTFMDKPFILPTTSIQQKMISPIIMKFVKKLIRYYPAVEMSNCIKCQTCVKACPTKAIRLIKKGIVFDYSKCIACFCCQELCPASAIKTKKSLFAKMIGL